MSNVHTLSDVEAQKPSSPTSAPFPVPSSWQKPQNYRQVYDTENSRQQQPRSYFMYTGIDGTPQRSPLGNSYGTICCTMCCPCFVPPLCSDDKRSQYANLAKTICGILSFVQLIMLIVALGLGGVVSPSVNPSIGPGAPTLIELGAKDTILIKQGQVWRFITPVFLHAGILHLLFNLFAQLRFGVMLEQKWGKVKFGIVYFISAISGTLMSCLLSPASISVGASGALMGLLGGALAECIMTWDKSDPRTRKVMLFQILLAIGITMIFSSSQYIDASAHFGGVVAGFLLTLFIFKEETSSVMLQRFSYAGVVLLGIYFVLGFVLFFTL